MGVAQLRWAAVACLGELNKTKLALLQGMQAPSTVGGALAPIELSVKGLTRQPLVILRVAKRSRRIQRLAAYF